MKTVTRALIITMAILMLLGAAGCAEEKIEYKESEVIEAAEGLIEGSYEINEIYFGKGLPVSEADSEAAKEFYESLELDIKAVDFLPVTEESPYKTIEEIKEATEKVYSAEYCEILYGTAFTGVALEDKSGVVYARYIEDSRGVLTARIDIAETAPELLRTYDVSTIEVTETKASRTKICVQSYLDGEKDEEITLTLVLGEDGWRLDSPTY